jgi:phage FluMu gp28-like protein
MDYLASKEHFLQVSEQSDKRIAQLKSEGKELNQEEMEVIIERTGLHRAYNELVQAENTLINWSQTAIRHEKEFIDNRETFEELYEKVKTDHSARVSLINLAMRLTLE